MDVCVHEIEGAMFNDKTEDCANYMGRWAVCGFIFLHDVNDGCYTIMWNTIIFGNNRAEKVVFLCISGSL